jgi:ferritin
MDKKLVKAFNEQMKNEFYSSYLYLAMAAYFESINLEGFAHWMKVQAKEELAHGMKFFEFLNDRGERTVLEAIPKPPANFASAKAVFEETLKHEKKVTGLINKLYEASTKAKDNAAAIFLQWFISEQVEEEKSASSILEKLKIIKPGSGTLLVFDQALGKRE